VVDDIEEFQRQQRKEEKDRYENELREVKEFLNDRGKIHEAVNHELSEEIKEQKNRLERAQKDDRPRIHDILEDLYRERREELLADWRDRESLRERKLYLEREIDEIESVIDLDLEY